MTGDDDVAVVTGANEGIGHHILRGLYDDGYRVAGFDVDGSNLLDLQASAPDRVRFVECDVTSDDAVAAAVASVVDRWGRIDVLVNNAAIFEYGFFTGKSDASFRREFDVNFKGSLRLVRAVLPHMVAAEHGHIYNVGSGAGLVGHPGLSGYAATKGAIEGFTRSLRLELQRDPISASVMYPNLANTRSAATLGYPDAALSDPADVGRRLASKVGSTRPAIYSDLQTRLGVFLGRRLEFLVRRGTARFLDDDVPETPED